MEKKVFVLFLSLLICFTLIGCGKNSTFNSEDTITCTKNHIENSLETSEEIKVIFKNDAIKSMNSITTSQIQNEYLDLTLQHSQSIANNFNLLDGIEYNVTKTSEDSISYNVFIDYEKIDREQIKKVFEEYDMEENYINYGNTTLNNLKETLVNKGYICN